MSPTPPIGSSSVLADLFGGHNFLPETDLRVDSNELVCCEFCNENIDLNDQLKCKGRILGFFNTGLPLRLLRNNSLKLQAIFDLSSL